MVLLFYMHYVFYYLLVFIILFSGCAGNLGGRYQESKRSSRSGGVFPRMLESIGKVHESQRKCWQSVESQGKSTALKKIPGETKTLARPSPPISSQCFTSNMWRQKRKQKIEPRPRFFSPALRARSSRQRRRSQEPRAWTGPPTHIYIYIYIYIYIERERYIYIYRERDIYIYIYV